MRDALRPLILCLLPAVLPLRGAPDLEEDADFQSALAALRGGQALVAAAKSELLLERPSWSAGERAGLAALAVEARVRAGDGAAALALLEREPVQGADYWRAQALALEGRHGEAEALLTRRLERGDAGEREKLLLAQLFLRGANEVQARGMALQLLNSASEEVRPKALLILAEASLAIGEAQAALEALPDSGETEAAHLRARALLDLGRGEEAEAVLRGIITARRGGESLVHSASLMRVEAGLESGRAAEALEALTAFLENTPRSTLWPHAFDLLARVLEELDTPPPDVIMRWMVEGGAALRQSGAAEAEVALFRGHAMLALSRWLLHEGRKQEALGLLESMAVAHPEHPQAVDAMRLALQTHGALGNDTAVAALASLWRGHFEEGGASFLDFITGGSAFVRGDYEDAADDFFAAANTAATLSARRAALFNACVAALRAGELLLYQTLLGQLQIVGSGSEVAVKSGDSAADLELDRALELASVGGQGAVSALNAFLENHASHPRALEACLALAELAMLSKPPNFSMSEKALSQADVLTGLDDGQRQRVAVTRLWLLERQGKLEEAAALGGEFLKNWPGADQEDEVRMKVAEVYFRLEDFAAARTGFELLAQEHPESPYAESALYFAALSAMSMLTEEGRERALQLWQEIAERAGPLAQPALHQLAQARRLAGEEAEALRLTEMLLAGPDLAVDMRRQLVCEKAEMLMLLGRVKPAHFDDAAAVLRAMLEGDGLPYAWRARAGHTLATVLHAAGQSAEALAACHDVVEGAPFGGPANPAEFRWYYRAGFLGIELLEAARQWESAARLAEKLGSSRGERAQEAAARATKIRLDHFIWDEKK